MPVCAVIGACLHLMPAHGRLDPGAAESAAPVVARAAAPEAGSPPAAAGPVGPADALISDAGVSDAASISDAASSWPDQAVPSTREPVADPFAMGTRAWGVLLGRSRDPSLGRIIALQVEHSRFIRDGLSISIGGTFGYAEADAWRDGVLGGPEAGIRWHLLRDGHASLFLDGGAAMLFQQHPLTRESLRFNFDLKAGLGATLRLDDRTSLIGGLRWHHLSNARVRGRSRNLGYDGPMLSIGLLRTF